MAHSRGALTDRRDRGAVRQLHCAGRSVLGENRPDAATKGHSGLVVVAHERDTLETLAASYHVPLWAVAQVNPVAKNTLLTEGQRIVVPRHLTPMTPPSPISSYAAKRTLTRSFASSLLPPFAYCLLCSRRTRPETLSALGGA